MSAKQGQAKKKQTKAAKPTRPARAAKPVKAAKVAKAAKPVTPINAARPAKAAKPASRAKAAKAMATKPATATATKPVASKVVVKEPKAKATASPESGGESQGLREGDSVPSFSLVDQHGNTASSDSLRGNPFVLYFYPKDDTPGCTREACAFRDDHGKFQAEGVPVFGVSPDDSKSHSRFAQKYGLNFSLLSDPDKTLAAAFGVWVMKQNYGREYMGIERSTFLVDGSGKIQKVWRRVKVDGHAASVLASASSSP